MDFRKRIVSVRDLELATFSFKIDELYKRLDTLENELTKVVEIPFRLINSNAKLPYKHLTGMAYDLYLTEDIIIYPWTRSKLIGTGVAVNFPINLAGETHARSSINKNTSIRVNVGLIDNDYTGEIFLNVDNLSWWRPYKFKKGDRLAQLKIVNVPVTTAVEVDYIKNSQRGANGFGSSGK